MAEFRMPSLGPDMEEGTLVEWLVKPGDAVNRGDIVALVDTEKALIEVEVFVTGVVDKILVGNGELVPVGTPLAIIRGAEEPEEVPMSAREAERAAPIKPEMKTAQAGESEKAPQVPSKSPQRVRASPAARELARKEGIDLTKLVGGGPSGAIVYADVERAAKAKAKPAAREAKPALPEKPKERVPEEIVAPAKPEAAAPSGMRRIIAAAMARSKREIPHYYLAEQINMHNAMTWMTEENLKRPITERLLPAALLIKATALAVKSVPELNGFCIDGVHRPSEQVHVGVAISLKGGLVAPAIHDTAERTLSEIMEALRDLVTRARAGRLRSSEMSDPTITLTNLGDRGVDSVFGVIYPPQVSIVGFGRITEQAIVMNGGIHIAPAVRATLSADHRVSDGHRGALFLDAINRLLQTPEKL